MGELQKELGAERPLEEGPQSELGGLTECWEAVREGFGSVSKEAGGPQRKLKGHY